MMKRIMLLILAVIILAGVSASAGNLPAPDQDILKRMLVSPDMDFSIFEPGGLCSALIYLIDNDTSEIRDRLVRSALCVLPETKDERVVDYLIMYLDEYTLDCLHGLGEFSTLESVDALKGYVKDDDEFARRYSAQSLGKLDFTVSDEMWARRASVLSALQTRLDAESEDWVIPHIQKAIDAISAQQYLEEPGGEIE